nr:MAG TPA: hypothetical protein [Caudoviricetes sp.]
MSDKYIQDVYCVYIPSLFNQHLSHDKLGVDINNVWQFEQLAKVLPLEDVFFFIYKQTSDPSLVKFMTDNDLFNVLTHPKNISWMRNMEKKYSQYLQKNQFEEKPPITYDIFTQYDIHGTDEAYRSVNENVIIFYDANISDENDIAIQSEILEKRRLKFQHQLFDMLGFSELKKHKVMYYLTKLN